MSPNTTQENYSLSHSTTLPKWATKLCSIWKMDDELFARLESGDLSVLTETLNFLHQNPEIQKHPLEISDQLLDRHLLHLSPTYLKSRELFIETGGKFVPKYLSKARTLTSGLLLSPNIEYSPVGDEIVWVCSKQDYLNQFPKEVLWNLKESSSPLFHEQNHRILWATLPKPGMDLENTRRLLHLAEAICVTLDFVCAHELGNPLSDVFNNCGVITSIGSKDLDLATRDLETYKKYLEIYTYTSYLNLQLYKPSDIADFNLTLFANTSSADLITKATRHALSNLEVDFVRVTCPAWENLHLSAAQLALNERNTELYPMRPVLNLPSDPSQYKIFTQIIQHVLDFYEIQIVNKKHS